MPLYVHGRQRQYLRPLLLPQFRRNNTTDSRSNRFSSLIDQHTGIIVKLDHTAIRSLPLLCCPYYNRVSYISAPYFVRCADGNAVTGFGTEISLFLYDYYYAVACFHQPLFQAYAVPLQFSAHTNFRGAFRSQDVDAFNYGGTGVVDAIYEGLEGWPSVLALPPPSPDLAHL
jgi:hypothetical protein